MTAEWVVTLPAVGLALAVVIGGISLAIDRGRLTHAAADGQRVLSYGGSPSDVTDYVHRVLGATDPIITIGGGEGEGESEGESRGEYVRCVTVSRPESPWLGRLLAVSREATSCGLVVPR
jgi:hypothetical protein